jgi:hypothetical protein
MEKKICVKCGVEKEISNFYFRKDTGNYRNNCSECSRKKSKNWYEENKTTDEYKKYMSDYTNNNKEKKAEYYKEWSKINKDKITEARDKWVLNNPDKVKKSRQKYKENNRDKINEQGKEYYKNNKEACYQRNKKIIYHKYDTDPLYKLKFNLRKLINNSIKRQGYGKISKSFIILGCEFEQFKNHIESKFEPWMTWENYGGVPESLNQRWDIDHIIPVSSAKDESEIVKLNHFTNLQPLCSYYNRYIKSDKILNHE